MGKIGVFTGIHAACPEPDLAFNFINFINSPDNPITLRDLIFDLARGAVIKVKMTPAIAFRHPDDLLAVAHIITILAATFSLIAIQGPIREKCFGFFGDESAGLAGRSIDLDHAVNLMPALVVFKGECETVLPTDQ